MTAAVGLHAGGIFFLMGALLIPEAPDAPQTAAQAAGRLLLQALEWIGAMERDGSHYHGDLDSVMRAFAASVGSDLWTTAPTCRTRSRSTRCW